MTFCRIWKFPSTGNGEFREHKATPEPVGVDILETHLEEQAGVEVNLGLGLIRVEALVVLGRFTGPGIMLCCSIPIKYRYSIYRIVMSTFFSDLQVDFEELDDNE